MNLYNFYTPEWNITSDVSIAKNVLQVVLKYRLNSGTKVKKTDKDIQQDVEKKTKSLF